MAVEKPISIELTNFTGSKVVKVENNPEDLTTGTRDVEFSPNIYISEEDFAEIPPKGFHRLTIGGEVRLKGAGIIKCEKIKTEFVKCEKIEGNRQVLECSFDPNIERKVKSTIHWVNESTHKVGIVEWLKPLFNDKECEVINNSSTPRSFILIEPLDFKVGEIYQFMRMGYFKAILVEPWLEFREIINLKDSWKK